MEVDIEQEDEAHDTERDLLDLVLGQLESVHRFLSGAGAGVAAGLGGVEVKLMVKT